MPHRKNQTSYTKGHAPTYGPQVKRQIAKDQQFGAWSIVREVEPIRHMRRFVCRCECGKEKVVYLDSLTRGQSKSCGCTRLAAMRSARRTHGLSSHPLYGIWCAIRQRCFSRTNKAYPHYGGRGIVMCFMWREDAGRFIEWARRNGWAPGLEVDRIDNDGNYEPTNCRLVSRDANQRNRSRRDINDLRRIYFPHEIPTALALPG